MAEIKEHAIDKLNDGVGNGVQGCDLHHHLFNEDYFIIGYYEAEQFLNKVGVFRAIGEIKEYEESNFGKVTTDISESEKVANMYAYIKGEELLADSKTLQDKWDEELTEEDIKAIIEELEYA